MMQPSLCHPGRGLLAHWRWAITTCNYDCRLSVAEHPYAYHVFESPAWALGRATDVPVRQRVVRTRLGTFAHLYICLADITDTRGTYAACYTYNRYE
jgi:hypothetical protein